MHLNSPYERNMVPEVGYENCFRLTIKYNGFEGSLSTNDFGLLMDIAFPKPVPTKGYFVVSTEENSYGIGQQKWFDGEVQLLTRDMGYRNLHIMDVTEYHYLGSTCSQKSYDQCLADQFAKFDSDSFLRKKFKKSCKSDDDYNSYVNETCSPFSLPFSSKKIPICQRFLHKLCFQKVIDKLMTNNNEHCKSQCVIKEYKIQKISDTLLDQSDQTWVFFKLPASTRRATTMTLEKNIKTEQYVISGLALLGNVGGMLGIFVGLSFIGVSDWIMTCFEKMWRQYWRHLDWESRNNMAENISIKTI